VLAAIAPYQMGLDAENEAIAGMHTTARSDAIIDLSDLRDSFETLALLEAEESGLSKRIEAIKQAIKLRMGIYTAGRCARWNVSYADSESTRIDSKRLKAELPETWRQYSKTTLSRTLRIKEA
jgi:predicted phage-related endonuclease